EAGTDIKGRLRSTDELRQASGYTDEPEKFADLMRILDSELKLVTPATESFPASQRNDASTGSEIGLVAVRNTNEFQRMSSGGPAGASRSHEEVPPHQSTLNPTANSPAPSESYYQLAHDYLVPSLRDWLTHHQRQTRAGRAALRLNELSAWWNAKPIARHLPGWMEWLNLRFSTRKRLWNPGEEKMMQAAARHHLARAAVVAVCLIASLIAAAVYHSVSQQRRKSEQAASLVAQLSRADITRVPRIVSELAPFFPWAQSDLRRLAAEGDAQSNVRLSAALALQQAEGGQTEFLRERLLDVSFEAFPVVRDALDNERNELADWLWPRFRNTSLAPSARFRAGMALANAVPHATDWTAEDWDFLARRLVTANADQQKTVRAFLKPVGNQLIPPIRRMFGDVAERDTIREAACLALTDFAAEDLELLIDLIAQATPPQYAILEPVLSEAKRQGRPVIERLVEVAAGSRASAKPGAVATDEIPRTQPEQIVRGQRRAGAAIAAIRLGAPKVAALAAFQGTDDLEAVSQFIHNGQERGVTPADLLDGLDVAQEVITRFGLILALGEYPIDTIPTDRRESLVARLNAWYANDPSAAIHAACGWLLATWRHPLPVVPLHTNVREALSEYSNEWIVQQVGEDTWTMIVHRPGRFEVGSPLNEPERTETETSGSVELPYAWMIADRELTRGQFEKFFKATGRPLLPIDAWSPTGEHPMIAATWFEAVLYCRWLT
ncbi:MAG: SUMF1/EgtB/PvdO family nonheme iron enzyme, partial [Planctomycetota bacterium]|nr:SUMF1/EgtB/PvdO family nonheme iron enzyme [Planctomycetota bacterium]